MDKGARAASLDTMHRRHFVLGLSASLATAPLHAREKAPPRYAGVTALEKLERQAGGRLGAFVFDPAGNRGYGWRVSERFAMCSTFKLSLAAMALREVDAGRLDPNAVLPYAALDILPNSPVTGAHAGKGGLAALALAQAAQETSDNLAANLLMARLGGPPALTAFWRSLNDTVSRLDRTETALNAVAPGDERDTTSPEAIARSVAQFTVGPVLTPSSRDRLLGWMAGTRTGMNRIRAGLPLGWRSGDKTGTAYIDGLPAKLNDIAVAFQPSGAPLVIAVFYEPAGDVQTGRPQDEAVLAAVGRIAADGKSWKLKR